MAGLGRTAPLPEGRRAETPPEAAPPWRDRDQWPRRRFQAERAAGGAKSERADAATSLLPVRAAADPSWTWAGGRMAGPGRGRRAARWPVEWPRSLPEQACRRPRNHTSGPPGCQATLGPRWQRTGCLVRITPMARQSFRRDARQHAEATVACRAKYTAQPRQSSNALDGTAKAMKRQWCQDRSGLTGHCRASKQWVARACRGTYYTFNVLLRKMGST